MHNGDKVFVVFVGCIGGDMPQNLYGEITRGEVVDDREIHQGWVTVNQGGLTNRVREDNVLISFERAKERLRLKADEIKWGWTKACNNLIKQFK